MKSQKKRKKKNGLKINMIQLKVQTKLWLNMKFKMKGLTPDLKDQDISLIKTINTSKDPPEKSKKTFTDKYLRASQLLNQQKMP